MGFIGKRDTYDSPFDDYKLRNGIHTKEKLTGIPSFDLSCSGAILMILSVLSFTLEFCSAEIILLCAALYMVVIGIWFISLRFLMTAKFPALNVIINYLYFTAVNFALGYFLNIRFSADSAINQIPLIVGLSMVASNNKVNPEKESYLIRDYLVPIGVPFVFVLADCLSLNIIHRKETFIIVLLVSMEIMLASYVVSKIRGELIIFAGERLSDVSAIPQNSKSDAVRFISARLIDLAYYLLGFTLILMLYSTFGTILPSEAISVAVIVIMSLYGILVEIMEHKYASPFAFTYSQYMIYVLDAILIFLFRENYIKSLSVILALAFCIVGFLIYVLLLAFATTYKRRLLFADINQYAKGVPHYLLLIGIILMIINAIVVV